MNVYVIESEQNRELCEYLKRQKYNVVENLTKLCDCSVIIVSQIKKVKEALELIDVGLQLGLDVICLKEPQYNFVCKLLIQDGACFV